MSKELKNSKEARGSESGTSFSKLLREHRLKKGLSLRALATECGVSSAYISFLENGTYENPSREVVKKLAKALDIDSSKFLISAGYLTSPITLQMLLSTDSNNTTESDKISKGLELANLLGFALVYSIWSYLNMDSDSMNTDSPEEDYQVIKELIAEKETSIEEEKILMERVKAILNLWQKDLDERSS